MKYLSIIVYIIVFFSYSGFVRAQSIRGYQLLSKLIGEATSELDRTLDLINSMGYIQGFLDSYLAIIGLESSAKIICLPEDSVSVDEFAYIIIEWLRKHPDQLHNTARTLIYCALCEAFPCTRIFTRYSILGQNELRNISLRIQRNADKLIP